jgi:hypothetical protein
MRGLLSSKSANREEKLNEHYNRGGSAFQRKIENPKSETRNPKQIQNPNLNGSK